MPKNGRKATPRKVASKKARKQRIKTKSNPFNRIVAKNLHHSVLGQKVKGNIKRPGHSISRSIEKRKQSLLKEYTAIETNKFNTFIDKRYEQTLDAKLNRLNNKKRNRDQQEIEKMIHKLTSQRLKSKQKVSYNLDDDQMLSANANATDTNNAAGQDGDNFTLTHLGAPINDETLNLSNSSHINFDAEDEDESMRFLYHGFSKKNIYKMIKEKGMTFEQVAESAGISVNKHENKTKPQVIKEQILRSRYKKCKAQIDQEVTMDDTELADSKFKQASQWIFAHRANKKSKHNKGNNNDNENDNDYSMMRNNEEAIKQKKLDLEYQQKLIEFEQDQRSGVTDRTVTDAQKAKRNYELLSLMEEKRKRKELGLPSDSDGDLDEDDDLDLSETKKKKKGDGQEKKTYFGEYEFVADDEEEQDAKMAKLEQMFERAQKGYDEENDAERESGAQDVEIVDGNDVKGTNWETLLERVAEEDSDGDDEDGDGDGDIKETEKEEETTMDNDEQYGYDVDIDAQFMPRKKKLFGTTFNVMEDDEEYEIGAEPAGVSEQNVFELQRGKKKKEVERVKQEKLKQKLAATDDFDIKLNAKKETQRTRKRKRTDEIEWSVLDLEEEGQDLTGYGLTDIPFILEVPENQNAFDELMSDKTASQQITLLKRMRSTNHVKLNENNKSKIIRLYDMLMEYFKKLCINYEPTKTNHTQIGALQQDIGFYQYIDVVTRALFALSHDIPDYAYSTHIKKLENISRHIHKHYSLKQEKQFDCNADQDAHDNDKDNKDTADEQAASYMPSGYILFYLKLLAHIFPTENKANPIISAVLLILCKCITEIPVNGARDISCYLFCITLILDIIKQQNRYVPEVMHSLYNLLRAGFLSDSEFDKTRFDLLKETDDLFFTFRRNSNIWNDLHALSHCDELKQMTLPIRWIFLRHNSEKHIFDSTEFKVQSLYSTLMLLSKCHEIWKSFLAYSEVFKPFYHHLQTEELKTNICECNTNVCDLYKHVTKCLKEGIHIQSLTRKPLQLIHKAVPIPCLEPEFDPDLKPTFLRLKVRNERALEKKQKRILKKAVKKQEKAVQREFQKDTQFIQAEKTKHRVLADIKRNAKWQHEWHNLTEQQRDTNSFQMVGRKLKKKLMKSGVIRGF
eukprot:CAMPEP_0197029944 /NCGR_PEP_ID=MMETSP1384-20130603/9284_1 /TAXON_ID=29189 /ORGANISM="Ammonia sp." /LENGTH=1135 /DNA_ID=CAMNT_0042459207 /DNA_START=23 /DNA_END=3430 /DNA_ORIENTATION=+